MRFRTSLSKNLAKLALAATTALSVTVLCSAARAAEGGLVDFLWGGSSEFGGGRQTISFSPQYKPGQVIVSFSDRRLYLVSKPGQAISYPIAVPRTQSRWQGTTFVSDKRVNPAWTPTPEMIRENPRLPRWVPGGHPMNPLGVRAMYLGSSSYRIHGTDAPWTIGQAVSKGCVRMMNEDVLDLYPRIPVGARVTVTWQRFSGKAIADSDVSDQKPAQAQRKTYRASSGQGPTMRRYIRPSTSLQRTSAAQ
jgi:lipoprotein-anchoring transpeptidase ErfK/SrfK